MITVYQIITAFPLLLFSIILLWTTTLMVLEKKKMLVFFPSFLISFMTCFSAASIFTDLNQTIMEGTINIATLVAGVVYLIILWRENGDY